MRNGEWVKWVLGIIIITVLPFMGKAIIANEEKSLARDVRIEDCQNKDRECLNKSILEQKETNKDILVLLAELRTDMKYLKKNVKNGDTP